MANIEEGFEIVLSGKSYDVRDITDFGWDEDDEAAYTNGWYEADTVFVITDDGVEHEIQRDNLTIEEEAMLDMAFDAT